MCMRACVFACVLMFACACFYAHVYICKHVLACMRAYVQVKTYTNQCHLLNNMDGGLVIHTNILFVSIVSDAPYHGHHTNGKTPVCVRHTI